MMEKRVYQSVIRVSSSRMHHHAGRLVDDNEVLVKGASHDGAWWPAAGRT